MKSKFSNYSLRLAVLFLAFSFFSCDTDEEFLINPVQDSSVSEVESIVVQSGKNRVSVTAVVDDPEISEVKVYWNDQAESVVIPVSGAGSFTTVIEGLNEGMHIFEAVAMDAQGKASSTVTAGAQVFGSNYEGNISNRTVAGNMLVETNLDVFYDPVDPASGIIGTEFMYENTEGEQVELFIDVDTEDITVSDFLAGSTARYRSVFVPSVMAIDTFYTGYNSFTPSIFPVLTNASGNIARSNDAGGRWDNLAHWTANDAVKNHNGVGGFDANNGFNVESGWGAPGIENGKIYQVTTAGAASYTLNVQFDDNNYVNDDDEGYYIVVAKGDGLPDVENIATAPEVLGYAIVTGDSMDYSIDFVVDEQMDISVGIVTTQDDSGRYGPITSFEIVPGP